MNLLNEWQYRCFHYKHKEIFLKKEKNKKSNEAKHALLIERIISRNLSNLNTDIFKKLKIKRKRQQEIGQEIRENKMEGLKDEVLQTLNVEERAKSQGKWATSAAAAKLLQWCPTL